MVMVCACAVLTHSHVAAGVFNERACMGAHAVHGWCQQRNPTASDLVGLACFLATWNVHLGMLLPGMVSTGMCFCSAVPGLADMQPTSVSVNGW